MDLALRVGNDVINSASSVHDLGVLFHSELSLKKLASKVASVYYISPLSLENCSTAARERAHHFKTMYFDVLRKYRTQFFILMCTSHLNI
jgi:hypothetical protein